MLIYLVFSCAVIGVFFFTALPFQLLGTSVSRLDLKIVGVSGSLFQGLHISELSYGSPEGNVLAVFKGVTFQYSHPLDLFLSRKMVFDRFTAEGADITITRVALPSIAASPTPQTERINQVIKRIATGDDPLIQEFTIQELRFSNVKLTQHLLDGTPVIGDVFDPSNMQKFEWQEVTLRDLSVSSEPRIGELQVSARGYDLRAKGLDLSRKNFRITELSGKVKKEFNPDHLVEDLDFHLDLVGSPASSKERVVSISALNGKIKGKVGPNSRAAITVQDLTIRDLYKEPIPLTHMNLEIRVPETIGIAPRAEVTGTFQIGEALFRLGSMEAKDLSSGVLAHATAMIGKQLYSVEFMAVGKDGMKVPLRLRSGFTESAQDNLAFLYFSSPYADLDEIRRLQIDTDLKYFDRSVGAAPKRVKRSPAPARSRK